MSDIRSIGVLGYHQCSEQDTVTTWEILAGLAMVLDQQGRKLRLELLAREPGQIEMQMGLKVEPQAVLGDELYDLFYVPGGVGTGDAGDDPVILDAIRRHYDAGKIVASNCSGVGVLHRAGILGNNPVTCIAAIARRLRELGANVPQPRRMWIGLPEQRLWTTVGASGVHGSTIALAAHYFGREAATTLSMMFDTYGALGDAIFQLQGPEYFYHPELESDFQDYWEDKLLPVQKAA